LYDLLHRCQRCKCRNPLQIPAQLIHRFYLAFTPQTFFFLLLAAELKPPLRAQLPSICAHLVRAVSSYHPSLAAFLMRTTAPSSAHQQQHKRLKRKAVAASDVQVQCASTVVAL
jgi:hypothetical protein